MQLSLYPEIDCQATAEKVMHFLDRNLDRYLALAGKRRFDLKSPSFDGMPKAPSMGNSNENRLLAIWTAEQVVDCVGKAMRNLTKGSQMIMLKRYSDEMTAYNIAEDLCISSTTYNRKQERALCEFADRFEYQLAKHGITEELLDLHVYKK